MEWESIRLTGFLFLCLVFFVSILYSPLTLCSASGSRTLHMVYPFRPIKPSCPAIESTQCTIIVEIFISQLIRS